MNRSPKKEMNERGCGSFSGMVPKTLLSFGEFRWELHKYA